MSTYSTERYVAKGTLNVANKAALTNTLAASQGAGSLAYTLAENRVFISNGSGWYYLKDQNAIPAVTLNATDFKMGTSGNVADLTYTVTDDTKPITVTISNSGIADTNTATLVHTASNNHVRITNVKANEGKWSGSVTIHATDQVNTGTATATLEATYTPYLAFKNAYLSGTGISDSGTGGTERVIAGGTRASPIDLTTMLTSTAQSGDIVKLNPKAGSSYGYFTVDINNTNFDTPYAGDIFDGKHFAIAGSGADPTYIIIMHTAGTGTSTKVLDAQTASSYNTASGASPARTYWRKMFNLTFWRDVYSGSSYVEAMVGDPYGRQGGCSFQNVLFDFRQDGSSQTTYNPSSTGSNSRFSWQYNNSNITTPVCNFINCSFVNYNDVTGSYSGVDGAVNLTNCAFDDDTGTTPEGNKFTQTFYFSKPTEKFTSDSDTDLISCQENSLSGSPTVLGTVPASSTLPFTSSGQKSRDFPGTDSNFIRYSNVATGGTGEYTIEGWFNFDTLASSQTLVTINGSQIYYYQVANKIRFYNSGGSANFSWTPTATGTWYHIALVRNASNVWKLFHDGIEDTTTISNSHSMTGQVDIGAWNTGAECFNGKIFGIRLSDKARYPTIGGSQGGNQNGVTFTDGDDAGSHLSAHYKTYSKSGVPTHKTGHMNDLFKIDDQTLRLTQSIL